jgi:hypothetical protein
MRSFEALAQESTADFVMFCDQDDVWREDKIELSLERIRQLVAQGTPRGMAVYCDLSVIDAEDTVTHPSFMRYHGVCPEHLGDPYYLACKNPTPGCALTVDRKLLDDSLPIGEHAVMHDWWVLLNAVLSGTISYIDETAIRYRIHQDNAVGVGRDDVFPSLASREFPLAPAKMSWTLALHRKYARQAREAFHRWGLRFSAATYWRKVAVGRVVAPMMSRFLPQMKRYSWRP